MEAVTHPEGETEASHPQLDSEAPTVGCSHAPCFVLCAHASIKSIANSHFAYSAESIILITSLPM